jgi:hypothetical protein
MTRKAGNLAASVKEAAARPLEPARMPQAPGRTPRSTIQRASGTTHEGPQRCPGAEDQPPEASEAPAREARKQ